MLLSRLKLSAGIIVVMTVSAVQHEEDTFNAADGRRLYEQRWLPDGEARAHIAIVHGYAEHSSRYAYVGEMLAGRGYAVHALDLRGHGRSDGPRAYARSFDEFLIDVRALLGRVHERADTAPVFLLGHSMGATIVTLELVIDRPQLRGALLSGGVLTTSGTPRVVRAIVSFIGRVAPRLPLVKLKSSDVSRDPEVVRRYDEDPLIYHGRTKAGLIAAMVRAVARIERDAPFIDLPILIMHGSTDALAPPEGSSMLLERIASPDKTLKLYDGLCHEILNEPERDQVIADIVAWLDARTA